MRYSVKFIDNFVMLKDLIDIRSRIANEFEPTQELDKYLLLTSIVDERINNIWKHYLKRWRKSK